MAVWHTQPDNPVDVPMAMAAGDDVGKDGGQMMAMENFLTEHGVYPMYRPRRRTLTYRILRSLHIR